MQSAFDAVCYHMRHHNHTRSPCIVLMSSGNFTARQDPGLHADGWAAAPAAVHGVVGGRVCVARPPPVQNLGCSL
jgi:hypothetical protein